MPKAVRFAEYGDIDVLQVVDVVRPTPGPGGVLIRVKTAGINLGETKIRQGLLRERFPATFPSGQGSDLAGIIDKLGPDVHGSAVG
jgi:NADPH:quinone reductase-like Zn-dependent oxidoreductase